MSDLVGNHIVGFPTEAAQMGVTGKDICRLLHNRLFAKYKNVIYE